MLIYWIKKPLYVLALLGCYYLASCQYHFGFSDHSRQYATISIPYAQGDLNGELTVEVIKNISSSGLYRYVNTCGDLILRIKILDTAEQNIDYRYDRKKTGGLKGNIIPTETRLLARAEVSLIHAGSGNIIKGPTCIVASTDFDHTYYTNRHEVNIFSLGQLNDIDVARDTAMIPLNRALAEKIADYIVNSW